MGDFEPLNQSSSSDNDLDNNNVNTTTNEEEKYVFLTIVNKYNIFPNLFSTEHWLKMMVMQKNL